MNLSARTLQCLNEVIRGDTQSSPYRKGPQLVHFFNDFGEGDLYGPGFPARSAYVREKLIKFNGTEMMKGIVSAAFDFIGEDGFNAEDAAYQFNQLLGREGFRLALKDGYGWMEGNREVRINPRFELLPLAPNIIAPTSLTAISHEAIHEQMLKANQKIESGDYSGAITNSYTLVEQLLKHLLKETITSYKDTEGDIRALYKILQPSLNLEPAKLKEALKPIVGGLQTMITGLYEIANKGSDRHARQFNPARHHAKLAVSAAYALCEFLVESRAYQTARDGSASRE